MAAASNPKKRGTGGKDFIPTKIKFGGQGLPREGIIWKI